MHYRRFSTGENSLGRREIVLNLLKRRHSIDPSYSHQWTVSSVTKELNQRMDNSIATISPAPCDLKFEIKSRYLSQMTDNSALQNAFSWLAEPILVSDTQLSTILPIKESTKTSPLLESGSICYFRSWEMQTWQLRHIIKTLTVEGVPAKSLPDFTLALSNCSDLTIVTMRYVGTTTAPYNPFSRTRKMSSQGTSVVHKFSTLVKSCFPRSVQHRIFELPTTYIPDLSMSGFPLDSRDLNLMRLNEDQIECCTIAFFKYQTLLNRQPGGKNATVGVGNEDERVLYQCKTDLLQRISRCESSTRIIIADGVRKLFDNWWDYASVCVWKDQDGIAQQYKQYIDSTYVQATPSSLNGIHLAVICAEVPPEKTLADGSTFLEGERDSGRLVHRILQSIAKYECSGKVNELARLSRLLGFNQLLNLPNLSKTQQDQSRVGDAASVFITHSS